MFRADGIKADVINVLCTVINSVTIALTRQIEIFIKAAMKEGLLLAET